MLSPVFFDSCAFDGGDIDEQRASNEIRNLFFIHSGRINVLHSVQKEINYPKTPQWVKDLAATYIGTLQVSLTSEEQAVLSDIERIIVGDGILENYRTDCRHIYEAQKYGRYFVTTDKRILRRSDAIRRRVGTLYIVRPTEFVDIVKNHVKHSRRKTG